MFQNLAIAGGLLLAGTLMLPNPTVESAAPTIEGAYAVDNVHSSVLFSVVHLGASRFYGRFNAVSGEIEFDPAKPTESSIQVEIEVDSVDTNNSKRDQHLRGPDFFSAKEFPKMTFTSESVKVAREASEESPLMLEVTGKFELAGKSRELTAMAELVGAGPGMRGSELVGFHSRFTIQRSEFGVDYMPDGLSDDVEVIISLEAAR